jgi:serine protease inhibitor
MRRRLTTHCSVKSDQKCHIVGLNLIKVVFNHYVDGWENNIELFESLVKWSNLDTNIYCCSVKRNSQDKVVEKDLLDCIIDQTIPFIDLKQDSKEMYSLFMELLYHVSSEKGLSNQSVETVTTVINNIETITGDTDGHDILVNAYHKGIHPMTCFICASSQSSSNNTAFSLYDPIFMVPCCNQKCQGRLWEIYGMSSSSFGAFTSSSLLSLSESSLLSPYSIMFCCFLLYLGSDCNQKCKLAHFLDIDNDNEKEAILKFNLNDSDSINGGGGGGGRKARVTNQTVIFHRNDITMKEPYRRTISALNVKIVPFDMRNKKRLTQEVNEFSRVQSNNLIPTIISEDDLTLELKLLIVNTLYFNGKWIHPFDAEDNERNKQFNGLLSNTIRQDMTYMNQTDRFLYDENDKHQCIVLPYDQNYVMFILLPIISTTTMQTPLPTDMEINDALHKLLREGERRKMVQLRLPKVECRVRTTNLWDSLLSLYPELDNNPLSQMFVTSSKVDKMIQESVIKINEKGTEAAATTVVMVGETAMMPSKKKEKVYPMNVDHSFYYAVYHMKTSFKLFEGFYDS